ncbi:hypothetical protein K0M31_001186, partial [Melipona bicolor]
CGSGIVRVVEYVDFGNSVPHYREWSFEYIRYSLSFANRSQWIKFRDSIRVGFIHECDIQD